MTQRPELVLLGHLLDASNPDPVLAILGSVFQQAGRRLEISLYWSDRYNHAKLITSASPLPLDMVRDDLRILGQRTLNRRTRLDIAKAAGAKVLDYGAPKDNAALADLLADWKTDQGVLKYDWSYRRAGVFLWPPNPDQPPELPADFNPHRDLIMARHQGDPATYKVDAFGGHVLGCTRLATHDIRDPNWQMVNNGGHVLADVNDAAKAMICRASLALMPYGVGYASFDLMRDGDDFSIIEINTAGVGTDFWKLNPVPYAYNYANALLSVLDRHETLPRFGPLRASAIAENNDAESVRLLPQGAAAQDDEDQPTTAELFDHILECAEDFSADDLAEMVQEPTEMLLAHAASQVPHYAATIPAHDAAPPLAAFAVLSRATVRQNKAAFVARALPKFHGSPRFSSSFNSGPEALTVTKSRFSALVDAAVLRRGLRWVRPQAKGKILTFRRKAAVLQAQSSHDLAAELLAETIVSADMDPVAVLQNLSARAPVWLRSRPSLVQRLAFAVQEQPALRPQLLGIVTSYETLRPQQAAFWQQQFGCPVLDALEYSALGIVALRCPESGQFHAQSETCCLEILDAQDRPVAPGQWGRLVVTPLYNLFMPLIRFETGDFARANPATTCGCGRAGLTITTAFCSLASLPAQLDADEIAQQIDDARIYQICGSPLWQLKVLDEKNICLVTDSASAPTAAQETQLRAYLAELNLPPIRWAFAVKDLVTAAQSTRHQVIVAG